MYAHGKVVGESQFPDLVQLLGVGRNPFVLRHQLPDGDHAPSFHELSDVVSLKIRYTCLDRREHPVALFHPGLELGEVLGHGNGVHVIALEVRESSCHEIRSIYSRL